MGYLYLYMVYILSYLLYLQNHYVKLLCLIYSIMNKVDLLYMFCLLYIVQVKVRSR